MNRRPLTLPSPLPLRQTGARSSSRSLVFPLARNSTLLCKKIKKSQRGRAADLDKQMRRNRHLLRCPR